MRRARMAAMVALLSLPPETQPSQSSPLYQPKPPVAQYC